MVAILLAGSEIVMADEINPKDTIRTYNIEEIILTSSTKETNDLRKLPGSVTVLSPQQIIGRQIDALKDISSFVPNLYMPDYGAKLTSAIYIRGIGARSSGQSIGMYVDNVPYLDKSTFDFELTDIQRIEVLRGPCTDVMRWAVLLISTRFHLLISRERNFLFRPGIMDR